MYVYKPYPRWKYHRTKPPVLVEDEEQEAALGDGWASTPAAFLEPPKAAPTAVAASEDDSSDTPATILDLASLPPLPADKVPQFTEPYAGRLAKRLNMARKRAK